MATNKRNQLMQTLGFDTQDMTYNRNGEMSPRQQRQFLRGGRIRVLLTAALGGLGATVIANGAYNMSPMTHLVTQITNAIFFGWLAWSIHMAILKDAMGGRVKQVIGKPEFYIHKKQPMLCVGHMEFKTSLRLLDYLKPDHVYCVYYAPHSARLLALEPQSQPRSKISATPNAPTVLSSRSKKNMFPEVANKPIGKRDTQPSSSVRLGVRGRSDS